MCVQLNNLSIPQQEVFSWWSPDKCDDLLDLSVHYILHAFLQGELQQRPEPAPCKVRELQALTNITWSCIFCSQKFGLCVNMNNSVSNFFWCFWKKCINFLSKKSCWPQSTNPKITKLVCHVSRFPIGFQFTFRQVWPLSLMRWCIPLNCGWRRNTISSRRTLPWLAGAILLLWRSHSYWQRMFRTLSRLWKRERRNKQFYVLLFIFMELTV